MESVSPQWWCPKHPVSVRWLFKSLLLSFQRCLGFTLFLGPPASLGLWEWLLSFQSIPFCKVSQNQHLWLVAKGPPTLTNGKVGTLDPQLDVLEWRWNTGIPEWVAIPFPRGSSQPRVRTCVSCLLHWQAGSLPLTVLYHETVLYRLMPPALAGGSLAPPGEPVIGDCMEESVFLLVEGVKYYEHYQNVTETQNESMLLGKWHR